MGCEPLGFSPFLSKMFLVVVKQGLGDHRNYPWSMAVILLVFWSLGLTKDCWFRVSKKIQETREGRGDQLCTDWHHVDSKELEWPWDGATSTTPFQPHPNAQWFNLRDMIRPQNDKPIHAVCRLNQFLGGWIGEMLLPLAPFITLFYVQNRPGFRLCVDILKTDWSPAWTLQYLWLRTAFNRPLWTPALQFDDVPAVDEFTVSRLRMFKVATQLSCSRHIVSRNGTETRHRDHTSWWNMNFSGHCISAWHFVA